MTIKSLYHQAVQKLAASKIPTPEEDARAILSHHLKCKSHDLFLHQDERAAWYITLKVLFDIHRRCRWEPIAYILGYQYFYQDKFFVSRKTLIPRSDTEHLLYAAASLEKSFLNIIDIGTGTGAIAVSAARLFPNAHITAIDIDISTASRNIKHLGLTQIKLFRQNFAHFIPHPAQKYDLILSNPPYLSPDDFSLLGKDAGLYEPRKAFYGGLDGLDFYRLIANFALNYLSPDGWVIVEVDHKWNLVKACFENAGFKMTSVYQDYNQLERVLCASRSI